MYEETEKIERSVISIEEYLKKRQAVRRQKKSEPDAYSFELSSDSFLESLIKSVSP